MQGIRRKRKSSGHYRINSKLWAMGDELLARAMPGQREVSVGTAAPVVWHTGDVVHRPCPLRLCDRRLAFVFPSRLCLFALHQLAGERTTRLFDFSWLVLMFFDFI
jgi:hypothetical protein